jgi:hypothetical protein
MNIAGPVVAEPRGEDTDRRRVLDLIEQRIDALGLDLSGLVVATEAGHGPSATTPLIAAMAGASAVVAVNRVVRQERSFEEAVSTISTLARHAGVIERLIFARDFGRGTLERTDIVTNSAAIRPLDRALIERLPRHAVIALMAGPHAQGEEDFDLPACRERGIRIAAVNEHHRAVGVFECLGPLLAQLATDAGVPLAQSEIAILCDNDHAPHLASGIEAAGGLAHVFPHVFAVPERPWTAVAISLDPSRNGPLGPPALARLQAVAPHAAILQVCGEIDRAAARALGLARIHPLVEPAPGDLLASIGCDPAVRLQAGGLAAAAHVARDLACEPGGVALAV